MHLCARCIHFASCYDFSIGFWNYSDSVVLFVILFRLRLGSFTNHSHMVFPVYNISMVGLMRDCKIYFYNALNPLILSWYKTVHFVTLLSFYTEKGEATEEKQFYLDWVKKSLLVTYKRLLVLFGCSCFMSRSTRYNAMW